MLRGLCDGAACWGVGAAEVIFSHRVVDTAGAADVDLDARAQFRRPEAGNKQDR
jgi:hypothetical protein